MINPCLELTVEAKSDDLAASPKSVSVYMIDNIDRLAELAEQWINCPLLAIDTEFERRTTFYAKLALVQIYDGDAIYLIDPLKTDCPEALRAVFSSDQVVKILHSCKEDIEVFQTAWQCKINRLFDTQVAYHFVNQEVSIGYAKLVEEFTGIEISKQQTQSDWIKRPLSAAQLEYAAIDVLYLINLYQSLSDSLDLAQHSELFNQECEEISFQSSNRIELMPDYRDAKEVNQLSAIELSLFKPLFEWRERTARAENRTRNHIIKDQEMVLLSKLQPTEYQQLKNVREIHARSIRLYGEQWLEMIAEWQQAEPQGLPRVINPRDLSTLKPLSTSIEQMVKSAAQQINIPASILMSKRVIRKLAYALLTDSTPPAAWFGWRKELLADAIEEKTKQIVNN